MAKKVREVKPKTNKGKFWKAYFEKYYGHKNIRVSFHYRSRITYVSINETTPHGAWVMADAKCQKGDIWDYEKGFYAAYIKCLRKIISNVKFAVML